MSQLILIYAGQVELVKGGLGAKYMVENPTDHSEPAMIFKKKLVGWEIIGNRILCESINDGKSIKFIEMLKEKANTEMVTDWSVKERAMLEARKMKRELKVKDSGDIESLISAVKSTYLNHTERKAIALYIYNKIA